MTSLLDIGARIARREVSSREVTQQALQRVAELDGRLGAFLAVDEAGALAAAEASDRRAQKLGPLDGVPIAIKDNILTAGLATTAGSRMLRGFIPVRDATVVARLKRAGAVILGKTNLDEFGFGSSTESSAFQKTANPYDLTRTPGGSSGGSAAAVAAGQVYGALGTDTGGSIRQPAALCNVVGLKPTWGRVSRSGLVAFASSLDQAGPMTRTVADAAAMLQVIAGHDEEDSTSAAEPVPDYSVEGGVQGLRVGLPREYFVEGLDGEVASAIRAAADTLTAHGAEVREVTLPHTKYALAAYYVIASAEASSNLSRYDGVRFGFRAEGVKELRELYEQSRAQGFGDEARRRIMLGTFALSAGYHDAYYVKAQQVRALIRRDFDEVLREVDVVLSAASPVCAWSLGEKTEDPLSMYLMDVLTLPCSLAGLPGLSVPAARSSAGLPIGAQLIGRRFDEATLLRTARVLEAAAGLHHWRPSL